MQLAPQTANILTDADFENIRAYVYQTCGINLSDSKRELVRSRLSKRLNRLGLASFAEYWRYLKQDSTGDETVQMIDAITTNKTDFFREPAHFELLQSRILPELARRRRPVRMWSSACSTGEEPYTIAMTALELNPSFGPNDIKILATDIAVSVLQTAAEGVYHAGQIAPVPAALRSRYFQRGQGEWSGHYRVKDNVRRLITFGCLNLMDEQFPMRNPLDVIFCRNVMIYFDKPTQERLVDKLVGQLSKGGYLMIGHSETLAGGRYALRQVAPTVFEKT